MAGTMKMFSIRKNIFPIGKKNLLFLQCNIASVEVWIRLHDEATKSVMSFSIWRTSVQWATYMCCRQRARYLYHSHYCNVITVQNTRYHLRHGIGKKREPVVCQCACRAVRKGIGQKTQCQSTWWRNLRAGTYTVDIMLSLARITNVFKAMLVRY